MIREFIKKNIPLFLIVLLSIPAIYILTHPGFFVSDDGEWMIIRLSAFYETFRSGEFPVRFIARLNNGYGYPISNFMYPGFLYLGSVIHVLGFGFTSTIKIIFGLSLIFSGIFTYFWLRKLFSTVPSFIGALLYIYMPYHLFDMYARGSIGEMLALCVIPFIFWQIQRRDFVLTALGIGSLVLSHNTLAFLFVLPIYGYLFLITKQPFLKRIFFSAVPLGFGALVSAFFWMPALYDLQYTIFKTVVISDWQQYFASIELIGIVTITILICSIAILFTKQKQEIAVPSLHYSFIGVSIVGISLSIPLSIFFWNIFPVSLVQFPFRMLSLIIPATAFLAASFLSVFPEKKQYILGMLLVILSIMYSYPYFSEVETFDKGDMYYISNFSTTTVKDEYMPNWVKKPVPPLPNKKIEITQGNAILSEEKITPREVIFRVDAKTKTTVQLNTIYFPGWEARVNEQKQPITYRNEHGVMQLLVPSGNHIVRFTFTETPFRLFANILSMLTFGILVVMFLLKVRYNAIKRKK